MAVFLNRNLLILMDVVVLHWVWIALLMSESSQNVTTNQPPNESLLTSGLILMNQRMSLFEPMSLLAS